MSVKTFCDWCGVEITDANVLGAGQGTTCKRQRVPLKNGPKADRIAVEVVIDEGGDFCKHCVADTVKVIDDRPGLKVVVPRNTILEAIARGWCTPKNSGKTVDPDLATAIADEIYAIQ